MTLSGYVPLVKTLGRMGFFTTDGTPATLAMAPALAVM